MKLQNEHHNSIPTNKTNRKWHIQIGKCKFSWAIKQTACRLFEESKQYAYNNKNMFCYLKKKKYFL